MVSPLSQSCPTLSKCMLCSCSAPMDCALLWVDALVVAVGSARMDESGLNQLCERCGERLNRVKHHRPCGVGRACHPRCKPKPGAAANPSPVAVPAAAPKPPRKRRADSDPGQPHERKAITRRVTPPRPLSPVAEKRTTRADTEATRLLDETHARRMAWLAAHSSACSLVFTP